MVASLYAPVYTSLVGGLINFGTDTIKAMITTSTYTPDPLTHQFKSSVTNEVTGTGYTARGATLASKTSTLTVANSWATSRANSTAYALRAIVRPASANGYLYEAVVAGTSGGTVPTWPTVVGATVTDGGVTWVNRGRAVLVLDFADPSWASSTITGRTVVVYKDTGTDGTSPLIGFDTNASDVVSSAGTWTYQVEPVGFVSLFVD
jgi:hypothetical protein